MLEVRTGSSFVKLTIYGDAKGDGISRPTRLLGVFETARLKARFGATIRACWKWVSLTR